MKIVATTDQQKQIMRESAKKLSIANDYLTALSACVEQLMEVFQRVANGEAVDFEDALDRLGIISDAMERIGAEVGYIGPTLALARRFFQLLQDGAQE